MPERGPEANKANAEGEVRGDDQGLAVRSENGDQRAKTVATKSRS